MNQQIAWMVDFVDKKLRDPQHWTATDVLPWICGIGLPPVGTSEVPYVWLWKGIQAHPDPAETRRKFAVKLAECAEQVLSCLDPDRALFVDFMDGSPAHSATVRDLLSLSRLLEQPDILARFCSGLVGLTQMHDSFGRSMLLGYREPGTRTTHILREPHRFKSLGEQHEIDAIAVDSCSSSRHADGPHQPAEGEGTMPGVSQADPAGSTRTEVCGVSQEDSGVGEPKSIGNRASDASENRQEKQHE